MRADIQGFTIPDFLAPLTKEEKNRHLGGKVVYTEGYRFLPTGIPKFDALREACANYSQTHVSRHGLRLLMPLRGYGD